MKSFKMVVLSLIFLVCATACQPAIPHNLPDREIIYQVGYYGLGFMNADGQDNQVFELKRQFTNPVWSLDGQYLYGLSRGKGLGIGRPAVWDLSKKRFKVCDWNLPYFEQIQSYDDPENPYTVIVQNSEAIVHFDIATCEINYWVNYTDKAGYVVSGFSYSRARQELVYGLVVGPRGDEQHRLMLLNLTNGMETQLAEGINPSWSPESSQVAFVGLGGIYLMSITDKDAEITRLTDEPLFDPWRQSYPWPGDIKLYWSPDGANLVYHHYLSEENSKRKKVFIYKVNIHERVPEAILEGGYYPSWHP